MKDLRGRVAVVTGAASGIGRALAGAFSAEGMRVVLADIESAALDAAVEEITAAGGRAVGVVTDVASETDVQRLADRAVAVFGAVHVLCNNAGVETGGAFANISAAQWRRMVDVDLMSVVHGCRVFLPLIRAAGEGHIVNTGSHSSFSAAAPTMAPYTMVKFGVLGLSESLDRELRRGGEPIGVSLLAPGPVRTAMPFSSRNLPPGMVTGADDPQRAEFQAMIERLNSEGMDPGDVADMVVEAIRDSRFFVLTHPEMSIDAVRERLAWMEGGPAPE